MAQTKRTTRILLLLLLLIIGNHIVKGQNLRQSIRGTVVDKDSKTPLIGVNLVIKDSDPIIGTITDTEGNFRFDNLPIGRHSIKAFYMGYEPATINSVLVNAGKELVLTVEMAESVEQLEEIVVNGNKENGKVINEMATVSARSFSVEETKRYAGSYNDPARMASSYAGVTGDPSGNNDIVIRGNSPRGLLWRLEGIEIPNPNHFAEEGATGGPIGILNSNMLRNSDFFTGAFPAEYGNAYSGVFDINLRKGNNENREYSFMAGMMGLDASVEGPFVKGKKASYLLNYRYSTLAILDKVGLNVVGDFVPEFQDLAFNIHLPTKKAGTFSLFGVGGVNFANESDTSFRSTFRTSMGVLGLKHTYFIDNNTYIKTTLAATGTTNNWSYFETNENNVEINEGNEDLIYKTGVANITFNRKFDARNTVKAGAIYTNTDFDLNSGGYDHSLSAMRTYLSQKGNAERIQGFANWKHRLNKNISVMTGVHYIKMMLNDNYSIEPRLGFNWQFQPKHSISAGFGIHSKVEKPSIYYTNTSEDINETSHGNKNLDFSKARHYVLGYQYRINRNLNLKTEFYYQDLYDIPVSKDTLDSFSALNFSNGYTDILLDNKGTGYNYGAEITLEKFFSNNYYFLVTTSLFESKYRGSDNVLRNTRYNGNYVVNLLGGKEFKLSDRKTLGISVKASRAGGLRYTPIDLNQSITEETTVRSSEKIYEYQREDFMRIDLKIRYRINKKKTTRIWEIDIQNLTNNANVAGDYFNTTEQRIETWEQMSILPVLSYRIEF